MKLTKQKKIKTNKNRKKKKQQQHKKKQEGHRPFIAHLSIRALRESDLQISKTNILTKTHNE